MNGQSATGGCVIVAKRAPVAVGASDLPRAESESLMPLKKPMPCRSASIPLRIMVIEVKVVAPAIV